MFNKIKFSLAIIFLSLLLSSLYSPDLVDIGSTGDIGGTGLDIKQVNTNPLTEIISQSTNSYIIIFIVFLLSALVYMGGSIFSVPSWMGRAKDLFYQGIFSLVIMASLPVIFVVFQSIFMTLFLGNTYTLPPNTNIFDLSENLLIWNYVYFFLYLIFLTILNLITLAFFGRTYNIPLANTQIPFDLTVIQTPLLMVINMGVGILSFSIMINGFQLLLLNFVRYTLLPFLLPIGLLLRAFPSSMNAGNILVGVAIASYIIVPVVYALDLHILPLILDIPQEFKDKGYDDDIYNSFSMMVAFYNKDVLDIAVVQSHKCEIVSNAKKALRMGYFELEDFEQLDKDFQSDECNIGLTKGIGFFYDSAIAPLSTSTLTLAATFIAPTVIDKSVRTSMGIFSHFSDIFKWLRNKITKTGGTTTGSTTTDSTTTGSTTTDSTTTDSTTTGSTTTGSTTTGSTTTGSTTTGSTTPTPAGKESFMTKITKNSRLLNVLSAVWGAGAMFYLMVFYYEFIFGAIISFIILSAILPFLKFTIIILFIREFTLNFLGTQVSLGHITRLL